MTAVRATLEVESDRSEKSSGRQLTITHFRRCRSAAAHSAVVKAGALAAPLLLVANLAGGYWFVRSGWVAAIDVLGSIPVAVTIPAAPLTGRLFRTHPQAGAGRGGPAAAPTPNAYVAVVRNPKHGNRTR